MSLWLHSEYTEFCDHDMLSQHVFSIFMTYWDHVIALYPIGTNKIYRRWDQKILSLGNCDHMLSIFSTFWVLSKYTNNTQYIVSSFKLYQWYSVYFEYTQHMITISQAQYFLIPSLVYFICADWVKCNHMVSVSHEYAENMLTKHVIITKLSTFWI